MDVVFKRFGYGAEYSRFPIRLVHKINRRRDPVFGAQSAAHHFVMRKSGQDDFADAAVSLFFGEKQAAGVFAIVAQSHVNHHQMNKGARQNRFSLLGGIGCDRFITGALQNSRPGFRKIGVVVYEQHSLFHSPVTPC
ncbi:MAG: hypothetical protein JMDDDDMK_02136 [Acidobacteria bacterium]|nr:hypothetical protein [Acidobacteriota bacterium]